MLNDMGTRFEVALEILGQSRQPFMHAIADESNKENPSESLISYCKSRLSTISRMQDELQPSEIDTANEILNQKSSLFPR